MLTKPRLIGLLGLLLVTPWLGGGKDNLALIINFFALVTALFFVWKSGEHPKIGMVMPALLLGLFAWGGVSLLWTVNRYQTVSWLVQWLTVVGAFAIGGWLALSSQRREGWIRGYRVVAAVFGVYGMYLLMAGEYNRLTSTFYWANPMATFILPAVVLGVFSWAEKGKKTDGVLALVTTSALLLTNSRGGFLVLAVVGAVAVIVIRRKVRFWLRLVLMLIAVLVLSTVVAQSRQFFHGDATVPVEAQGSRFREALSGESMSVTDRINYLESSAQMFKDRPLGGWGGGTFATAYPQYQKRVISATTDPHSYYAQTIVELGAVGGILLLGVLASVLIVGWRLVRAEPATFPLVLAVVALLLHLGMDIGGAYPAILALAGVLMGLVYRREQSSAWCMPAILVSGLIMVLPVVLMYQSRMWAGRAEIEQDNHSFENAVTAFGKASQGLIYDPDTLTGRGINHYTLAAMGISPVDNAADAATAASAAIKLDPLDSQHYFLRARAYALQRLAFPLIEASYQEALSRDHLNHPVYYTDLAAVYHAQGKETEAVNVLTQCIELYPESVIGNRMVDAQVAPAVAQAYAQRAELSVLAGDHTQASRDIAAALKLEPENALAKQLQGRL